MIYTAITGDKDKPRDDVLCFSHYNKFKDPRLNAKIYKILPHLFLDTDWSIWIDGNVRLKIDPQQLLDMLGDKDIGVFAHPHRNCIYEEAKECKRIGLDDPFVIDNQTDRYKEEGYPKNAGLGACYIIVRRHTPEINSLCEKWWAEICRHSVRDQISFPYVFRDKVKYFNKPKTNDNEYFKRTGHKK